MTKILQYGLAGAIALFAFTAFYFTSYPTEYVNAEPTTYIDGATPTDAPPGIPQW